MSRQAATVPAYEGDGPYVFVCYARDDLEHVLPELVCLQDAGVNLWYDLGIPAGSEWSEVLAARIERCQRFLYFVTPRSVASLYCRQEVSFALDHGVSILSVHLEPVDLPAGLRLSLSNLQSLQRHQLDETTYRRQLIAALTRVAPSEFEIARAPPQTPALAVMPFKNLSSDPEQEFLSEGISEDILNRLANHADLVVKARTSAFALAARNADVSTIARALRVSHVLEGSLQKSGTQVRITARLIRADDESQIWSSQYTRQLDDVFALQDEIGSEVLRALNVHLTGDRRRNRPRDRRAYNAFLLGRFHANRLDTLAAEDAFRLAVEHDPEYADAHAALADIHFSFRIVPAREKLPQIRESLSRALASEPDHVLANQLQASVQFMFDLDYQPALDTLAGLHRTHPDQNVDSYATTLRCIGRFEDALALTEHSLQRDPLSPMVHRNQAMYLRDLGRYDAAMDAIDQAERLGLQLTNERAMVAFESGDVADLARWTAELCKQLGETHPLYIAQRAALDSLRGNRQACRDALSRISDIDDALVPAFLKWILALFSGDLEQSVAYFDRALDNREHLAFTWCHGSVGMRRLFPWYYDSEARQRMLGRYGLDDGSVARLRIAAI